MRRFFLLALGALAMVLAVGKPADAATDATQGSGAVYAVTYFEAAVTDVPKAAALAKQFAAASRREPGNTGFAALEEIGRPSRFTIFEGWHDKAASDAHNAAAVAFHDKLQPLLVGPFEFRNFTGFSVAGPKEHAGRGVVYVVTHVDVFPAGKDQAATLVTALADAGRKMPGNLWFDVLQVVGHANHFTLVEGWQDRASFDASLMAAATRDFRQKITPLEGALYDERLYHALQ
jgi:quinol monooxygenase YgiN